MTYTSELEIMNQSKFEVLHHTQLKFIQSFTTVIACDSVHFLAYMHDDNDGDNEDDDNDNDIECDANPVTRV